MLSRQTADRQVALNALAVVLALAIELVALEAGGRAFAAVGAKYLQALPGFGAQQDNRASPLRWPSAKPAL
jgi:hypothetical protein